MKRKNTFSLRKPVAVACLSFLIAGTAVLTGCSKPPDGTEAVNLLDFSYTTLNDLNGLSGDIEGFREYFKSREKEHRVLEFLEASAVDVHSTYGEIVPGVVLRSLPDNRLLIETPMYVTEGRRNEMLVSSDNETWYSTRTDFDKGIDNFRNRYHYDLEYDRENRFLKVLYSLTVAYNNVKTPVRIRGSRPVETLKKGMVFKHEDASSVTYDLSDKVVYLPSGTIIDGNFKLSGNLLNTEKENGIIRFSILETLYFYQRGRRFGLSFDNEDWRINIFAFKVASLLQVYADEDDHIVVRFGLYVNHSD